MLYQRLLNLHKHIVKFDTSGILAGGYTTSIDPMKGISPFGGKPVSKRIDSFDSLTETLSQILESSYTSSQAKGCSINGKAYIFGGLDNLFAAVPRVIKVDKTTFTLEIEAQDFKGNGLYGPSIFSKGSEALIPQEGMRVYNSATSTLSKLSTTIYPVFGAGTSDGRVASILGGELKGSVTLTPTVKEPDYELPWKDVYGVDSLVVHVGALQSYSFGSYQRRLNASANYTLSEEQFVGGAYWGQANFKIVSGSWDGTRSDKYKTVYVYDERYQVNRRCSLGNGFPTQASHPPTVTMPGETIFAHASIIFSPNLKNIVISIPSYTSQIASSSTDKRRGACGVSSSTKGYSFYGTQGQDIYSEISLGIINYEEFYRYPREVFARQLAQPCNQISMNFSTKTIATVLGADGDRYNTSTFSTESAGYFTGGTACPSEVYATTTKKFDYSTETLSVISTSREIIGAASA